MSIYETQVGAIIDRVVAMELLAVPDSDNASKEWVRWSQQFPYWTNKIARLSIPDPSTRNLWTVGITMRLVVSHIAAAITPDDNGDVPQQKVWSYAPAVMAYFSANNHLKPTGLSAVQYLGTDGVTIRCDRGMEVFNIPGQNFTALYIDFDLSVPLLIFD